MIKIKEKNKRKNIRLASWLGFISILLLFSCFVGLSRIDRSLDILIVPSVQAASFPDVIPSPEGSAGVITDAILQGTVATNPAVATSSFWQTAVGYIVKAVIRAILAAAYLIAWVFYCLTYNLVYFAEWVLSLILDPTFTQQLGGFTTASFVKSTAQTIANLCNMVYLFILIFIAISIMFGREVYKSLLVKLVIAALLTNFALVASGLVIDASQVIMYSILDSSKNTISGTAESPYDVPGVKSGYYHQGTRLLDVMQIKLGVGNEIGGSIISRFLSSLDDFYQKDIPELITRFIKLSGLIVFSLALTVTLITISIILVIRIAMLWILLIVSPVAVLFSILPQTQKWWQAWQENLFHYAFSGPILIFFLWLAFKVSQTISGIDFNTAGAAQSQDDFKFIFFNFVAQNFSIVFQFLLLIIIIWAGILIANQWGIKGSKNLDGLIKSTQRWGKFAYKVPLTAIGGLSSGLRGATWGGYKLAIWNKGRQMINLGKEVGAKKSELDNIPKGTPEYAEKEKEWKAKLEEVKATKESRDKFKASREKSLKRAALTSPFFLKKNLAEYYKKLEGDYFGDMDRSIKSFASYFIKSGTVGKVAESGSREMLFDFQNATRGLVGEWHKAAPGSQEQKNIGAKISSMIGGIAEKITKDKNLQDKIKKQIENTIFSDPKNLIVNNLALDGPELQYLMRDAGTRVRKDLFKEAAELAKTDALDFLKNEKNREEEAKKLKEFQEALNDLEKNGRFNADYSIRQILRGSVSEVEQKAIAQHLASSSTNLNKFVEAINKEEGNPDEPNNMNEAIKFLKNHFSEEDAITILRIAEKDADKTNNLNQQGWVTFDPVLNKARNTNDLEREEILTKKTSGWPAGKKVTQVNPIIFDKYEKTGRLKDETAARVVINETPWEKINNNPKMLNDIVEKIPDKAKGILVNNKAALKATLPTAKQTDFDNVIKAIDTGIVP